MIWGKIVYELACQLDIHTAVIPIMMTLTYLGADCKNCDKCSRTNGCCRENLTVRRVIAS